MTSDPHNERPESRPESPPESTSRNSDPRQDWPLPGEQPPRASHHEMFSTRLIVGVLIILLGGSMLADNLGWFEARHLLRSLWPLVLVAIGVGMVRHPQHRRSRGGGWVLIGIGTWLFLDKIGFIHVSLGQLLVPALFLFVGGVLVFRSLSGPPDVSKAVGGAGIGCGTDHAEYVRSFTMLSGCELRPVSRPFRGADLSAVMGGIKLDLSSARMEGEQAVIEVFAFWGGVEIHVPPDWTVTSEVTTLLAGYIDKRRPTSVIPAKTLLIKGMIVMSGVEIKN